jgi:recombination protein RecA
MAKKKTETAAVGTLADIPEEGFVETGVAEVDKLLGGGFPRRRITQIYGMPGVGKGYLLTRTMALNKHRVLYIDAEFALNGARTEAMGVDLSKVDHMPNSMLEEVAEYIVANIDKYDLVIIDSLAALTPMTIAQNEVGSSSIGLAARQIGHFNAKLRPKLYKSEAAVIGINQVRANLGFGQAETQAFGGWSWGHTVDLSLKLFKGNANSVSKQVAGDKRQVGHWCSVKVDKSRISEAGAETRFYIDYGVKFD